MVSLSGCGADGIAAYHAGMLRRTTRATIGPFLLLVCLVALAAAVPGAQSTDSDRSLGKQAAQQIVLSKGLYDHPRLEQFLEQLGARLVGALGEPPSTFQFAITDEIEPNAYALPGGYIFATRNIFAVASSEAEVAGIIAHEIIHTHRRHAAQAAKRSILPGILAVPGALVGVFNAEAGEILTAPSTLAMARYGRKQETEADDLGVTLAAAAGYDPLALERSLDRLTRTIELFTGESEKPSYFGDHPATADRRQRIEKMAAGMPRGPASPVLAGRESYLELLDGLVLGRNPAQGLLEDNVFLHPDLDFRMELPPGWKAFNAAAAFGAIDAKGNGEIVIGLGDGSDPEKTALETVEAIAQESGKKPVESKRVDVNGHAGFYVMYADRRSHLHLLWVFMGGKMFRMAGVGENQWREALRTSVLSLRPLTAQERAGVRVVRMRIEPALAGETIEALSKRTGNVFTPRLTAVLNDLGGMPLAKGQLVKIARREPFQGQ
jgi:predicted Zn-dependent protease